MRMGKSFIRSATTAALIGLTGTIFLSLMGCGMEEQTSDTTPPDHIINLPNPQGKYRYGVADTITVDFGEPIDTAALAVTFSPAVGIAHAFRDANTLLVFGGLKHHGQNHFPVNLNFTMTLAGLKDLHGNGLPAVDAAFQPDAWADSDYFVPNFASFDSLFSSDTRWMDSSSQATDSLITEGSLDFFHFPPEPLDIDDFKLIRLKGADTVNARLTTRKDVDIKLQVYGPFKTDTSLAGISLDTALFTGSTGASGRLEVKFNTSIEVHAHKLGGSFDAPGIYVIRMTLPQDQEAFYRLGLRIHKFQ
jgi:hypothetical protein